jgi:hypothetical protein
MACYRYDPKSRTFYEIKPTQLVRPDRGEGLTFKEQMMRGYRRVEERGQRIAGTAKGIKRIWQSAAA